MRSVKFHIAVVRAMKIVGLMTEDFKFFHDVVGSLKRKAEAFLSMGFSDNIPLEVGVIITTKGERSLVSFPQVVAEDDAEYAINMAMTILQGGHFNLVVVGIDPGPRPGMVVMADGVVLSRKVLQSPEQVASELSETIAYLKYARLLVRIGHGDPTNRNRSIRAIWDLVDNIEVVDETSTTRRTSVPDVEAALSIAQTAGEPLSSCPPISPTSGEIRDLQRLSRLESGGRLTISNQLAERVVRGEITLGEAIRTQERSISSQKKGSS